MARGSNCTTSEGHNRKAVLKHFLSESKPRGRWIVESFLSTDSCPRVDSVHDCVGAHREDLFLTSWFAMFVLPLCGEGGTPRAVQIVM